MHAFKYVIIGLIIVGLAFYLGSRQETQTVPGQAALARQHNMRGVSHAVKGELSEAIDEFDKALAIYSALIDQEGQREHEFVLARTLNNRANALRRQRKFEEAVTEVTKAIDITTRLVNKEGRSDARMFLAIALSNRGNCLAMLGQHKQATPDFAKAIEITERLVAEGKESGAANELILNYYNRGVSLRWLGSPDEAIAHFDRAIALRTQLGPSGPRVELVIADAHRYRGTVLANLGRASDAMEDLNQAIDSYTKLVEQGGRKDLESNLAMGHQDRGVANAQLARFTEAVQDYDKAVHIYTRLVDDEGRSELARDLARVLNNQAWLLATCLDAGIRDPAQAMESATRACELVGWGKYDFLDTLAAACAAAGDLDAAVKWQVKGIELAPEKEKAGLRGGLEQYQARMRLRQN